MVRYAPKDPTTINTLDELRDFVSDELGFVSQHLGEDELVLTLTPQARAPDRPREGMFAYADGTNWNPGSGKGTYEYNGTAWVRQGPYPSQYINITSPPYNGVGDGVTDNVAAFNLAKAALGPRGGAIYFPAGKYLFSSAVSINYPADVIYDVTLFGDGADATILFWPATNTTYGMILNYSNSSIFINWQSSHVRDMAFTCGSVPTGTRTGLTITTTGTNNGSNTAATEIDRVTFRGDDGISFNFGWAIDCNVVGVSNINFQGCLFMGPGTVQGIGLQYGGINATNVAVVLNCFGCTFNNHAAGFQIGNAFQQGVTFSGCNFTNNTVGFNVPLLGALLNGVAVAQASFTNCQFGVFGTTTGIGGNPASPIAYLNCTNNVFTFTANGTGVNGAIWNSNFIGNLVQGGVVNGTGFQNVSNPNTAANVISGNLFIALTNGIVLGVNTFGNLVATNYFLLCTNDVIDNAAVANGNIVSDGAWRNYTPTVSGTTGSAGAANVTATGRFKRAAKIVFFTVDITWTNIGSWTGTTQFTLPVTGNGTFVICVGRELNATGHMVQGFIVSATNAQIFKYDNTAMLTNGQRYLVNGRYEAA